MEYTRSDLKFLVDNIDCHLNISHLNISKQLKVGLLFINSMLGRYQLNRQYFKKITQKSIKESSLFKITENQALAYVNIFDFCVKTFHNSKPLNEYVENNHISSTIYEIVHYLFIEDLLGCNTSFREHIKLYDQRLDISTYNTRVEPYDLIRNNMILFWIEDKKLANQLGDFKRIEVYSFQSRTT